MASELYDYIKELEGDGNLIEFIVKECSPLRFKFSCVANFKTSIFGFSTGIYNEICSYGYTETDAKDSCARVILELLKSREKRYCSLKVYKCKGDDTSDPILNHDTSQIRRNL